MIYRLMLVCILTVSGLLGGGQLARGQSATLYPDLQTLPPSDLFFDKISGGTHILRFSNTVKNAGEGRLEIQGNPKAPKKRDTTTVKQIYQNLYNAPVGGSQTSHKQVASDAIFHAGHQHFHFADFSSYLLLQRDAAGVYQPTTKKGSKTSFCIMDTSYFQGGYGDQYRVCGGELQGLTPGWGDTYDWTLVDQWVVLGNQPLADGEYGLQSTADPRDVLDEGGHAINPARETNNTVVTYFTVSGGQITNVREAPVPLTAAIAAASEPGVDAQQSMDNMDNSENLTTNVPVVSPPAGTHEHVADASATAPDHDHDHDHESTPQGRDKQTKGKKTKHGDKGRKK